MLPAPGDTLVEARGQARPGALVLVLEEDVDFLPRLLADRLRPEVELLRLVRLAAQPQIAVAPVLPGQLPEPRVTGLSQRNSGYTRGLRAIQRMRSEK